MNNEFVPSRELTQLFLGPRSEYTLSKCLARSWNAITDSDHVFQPYTCILYRAGIVSSALRIQLGQRIMDAVVSAARTGPESSRVAIATHEPLLSSAFSTRLERYCDTLSPLVQRTLYNELTAYLRPAHPIKFPWGILDIDHEHTIYAQAYPFVEIIGNGTF